MFGRDCPCGSGRAFDGCCGPLHRQERLAATPEELMRSRYAAYAVGDVNHLFRTWHPRTRPEDLTLEADLTWTGLEILEAEDDVVEFRAHWSSPRGSGVLHERSRFVLRGERWVYLEALSRGRRSS